MRHRTFPAQWACTHHPPSTQVRAAAAEALGSHSRGMTPSSLHRRNAVDIRCNAGECLPTVHLSRCHAPTSPLPQHIKQEHARGHERKNCFTFATKHLQHETSGDPAGAGRGGGRAGEPHPLTCTRERGRACARRAPGASPGQRLDRAPRRASLAQRCLAGALSVSHLERAGALSIPHIFHPPTPAPTHPPATPCTQSPLYESHALRSTGFQ